VYQTLLSPLKRAEYLLSLQGINMEETDKLDGETEGHAEFIMEVMEARSALEEADSEEEMTRIRQENKCALHLVAAHRN
jgi:molecular chaperone HscB